MGLSRAGEAVGKTTPHYKSPPAVLTHQSGDCKKEKRGQILAKMKPLVVIDLLAGWAFPVVDRQVWSENPGGCSSSSCSLECASNYRHGRKLEVRDRQSVSPSSSLSHSFSSYSSSFSSSTFSSFSVCVALTWFLLPPLAFHCKVSSLMKVHHQHQPSFTGTELISNTIDHVEKYIIKWTF